MTIKRFGFGTKYVGSVGTPDIVGMVDGSYVLHSDYAALLSHNNLQAAQLQKQAEEMAAIGAGGVSGVRVTQAQQGAEKVEARPIYINEAEYLTALERDVHEVIVTPRPLATLSITLALVPQQIVFDATRVFIPVKCARAIEAAALAAAQLAKDAERWQAMRACFIGVEYDEPNKGMALFTCHIPQYAYRSSNPDKIADAAMEQKT